MIYETSLAGRDEIAEGTIAFRFKKPLGFSFDPGQAIDLIHIDPPTTGTAAGRHTFSLVTAPWEDELTVATRMRASPFKRVLGSLALGSAARIEGPFGSLTLHDDRARPAILLAGGIGVTPFMSILRQAARDRVEQDLILLYSSRRPEDAAFLSELRQLARGNERFRLIAAMTEMNASTRPWAGRTGPIDAELLREVGRVGDAPIYYIAGPPGMVDAMRRTLTKVGIADADIRSEEFHGY